jgi:hypothetical protein
MSNENTQQTNKRAQIFTRLNLIKHLELLQIKIHSPYSLPKSINERKGISSDIMNHVFSERISLKMEKKRAKLRNENECVADCEIGIESKTKQKLAV